MHSDSARLRRLTESLQQVDELTELVLKCHLLLEEQLDSILEHILPWEGGLEKLQLTFARKAVLARCFSRDPEHKAWRLVDALNAVRNSLAHRLPDRRDAQATVYFIKAYEPFRDEGESSEFGLGMIYLASAFLAGFLNCCEADAEMDGSILKELRASKKRIIEKLAERRDV